MPKKQESDMVKFSIFFGQHDMVKFISLVLQAVH